MSLVFITHHNENVRDYEGYGITHIPERHPVKYVSQHKKRVKNQIYQPYIADGPNGIKLITDRGVHEHRTMGCAHTIECPKNFLRKNTGIKWRRTHDHICPKPLDLAPVPRVADLEPIKPCKPKRKIIKETSVQEDQITQKEQKSAFTCNCFCPVDGHGYSIPCQVPSTPLVTDWNDIEKKQTSQLSLTQASKIRQIQQDRRCKHINFIELNRQRAIQAKPKRPPPKFVDAPNGYRQNLINSGLVPQFVCGKNFAKVPCYIKAHKKILRQYGEACHQDKKLMGTCELYMKEYGFHRMADDERVEILKGLRLNHGYHLMAFQTLPFYTDTMAKVVRKSKLEKILDQLEADIQFLEDNHVIYISDHPE